MRTRRTLTALALAVPLGVTGAVAPTVVASPSSQIAGHSVVQSAEAGSLGKVPAPRKSAREGAYCHIARDIKGGREHVLHWWNWKWQNGWFICRYGGSKTVRS